VTEARRHPSSGDIVHTEAIHVPILASFYADTMAAFKVSRMMAPAALLGCGKCPGQCKGVSQHTHARSVQN
jgi:hypothetical protein